MKEDFTSRFFSNHTTDIAKFYNEMENSSYMYKVHLTQRSYWLSRLLSDKESDQSSFILADALIMKATEIVQYYIEKGYFPSILICDLFMYEASELNNFLVRFENVVIKVIKKIKKIMTISDDDDLDIRTDVSQAVNINIYEQANKISMILVRYAARIVVYNSNVVSFSDVIRHQLSKTSDLKNSGISPNSFSLYSRVNENDFKSIKCEYKRVESFYRSNIQTVYMKIIKSINDVKAILTIRTHEKAYFGNEDGKCYITPNVFITNIGLKEKEKFLIAVQTKIADITIKKFFEDLLIKLKGVNNKFVTFLINQCLLTLFINKFNLQEDLNFLESEIDRIACNFGNIYGICEIVRYLKTHQIFTEKEFIGLLEEITCNSKNLESKSDYVKLNERLPDSIEKIIYEKVLDWRSVKYRLTLESYIPTKLQYTKENAISFFELVKKINTRDELSIYQIIDIILQLMDNGMISLVEDENVDVVQETYIQFFNIEMIVLLIPFIEVGIYQTTVLLLEQRCDCGGLDKKKMLKNYANRIKMNSKDLHRIEELFKNCEKVGLKVKDLAIPFFGYERRDFDEKIKDGYGNIMKKIELAELARKTVKAFQEMMEEGMI